MSKNFGGIRALFPEYIDTFGCLEGNHRKVEGFGQIHKHKIKLRHQLCFVNYLLDNSNQKPRFLDTAIEQINTIFNSEHIFSTHRYKIRIRCIET